MMKNIVVVFGGKSVEHDISVITAIQTYCALNNDTYKIFPVYISKKGVWYCLNDLISVDSFKNSLTNLRCKARFDFSGFLILDTKFKRVKRVKVDCVVVCMHGVNGEDGAVAGICEMCCVPYVNSGLVGSSVGLNKLFFKTVLKGLGIPYIEYVSISNDSDVLNKNTYKSIAKKLGNELIVKPNNLGSSIGVSKFDDYSGFLYSLSLGFKFDNDLLIERCLKDFCEYNIAIYKNVNGLVVSDIEQPINDGNILSFNDKYIDDQSKIDGMENLKRIFPASVSKDLKNKIINYAKKCYESMFLKGVVRFDFIYDNESKQLFLNEINTIPGSLANYLFRNQNLSFGKLLDEMIDFAIGEHEKTSKLVRYFESSVLDSEVGFMKK